MADLPIHGYTALMISEAGGAVIEIIGGKGCVEASVTACRERFAARLSIGGKVIGTIPADKLSDEQLEGFVRVIEDLRRPPR